MKLIALLGMITLIVCHSTILAAEQNASAKASINQKYSLAKHKRTAKTKNPYWRLEPYRSMGFIGEYPGEYARMKADGECVIDLGYGRWESCNIPDRF